MTRTSVPAELEDVLTQLKELLGAFEPGKGEKRGPLAKLVRDLDYVTKGNSDAIEGALTGSASVLGNLASNSSEITSLINNLDKLFVVLADRTSEISLVNQRFALVAEALQLDQDNLEGTIENVTLLSKQASLFITESGDDLGETLKQLEGTIYGLLEHGDALVEGARWTNVIAQALGATDASGRGLYAYTGKVATPGTPQSAYNYRLETRDTIACERLGVLVERFQTVNPGWGFAQVRHATLEFIPDYYDDDLEHLISLLLPPCGDLDEDEGAPTELSARAAAAVERAVDEAGREQFGALVRIWLMEAIAEGTLRAAREQS
jgi:hypothetical protein